MKEEIIEYIMYLFELDDEEKAAGKMMSSDIIKLEDFNKIMISDGLKPDYEKDKYEYHKIAGVEYLIDWGDW